MLMTSRHMAPAQTLQGQLQGSRPGRMGVLYCLLAREI